jgi:transcriptional regulator of acetoin/glycerol metabolism
VTVGIRTLEWAAESDDGIARAWERFVAGDDHVTGVSPDIVSSWYRCREHYRVDPSLCEAPVAPAQAQSFSPYDAVFAELGGSAVSVLQEAEGTDSIVTVADGTGRILAAWGDRATLSRARDNNLAPLSYWAEGASGTNGIGTALEARGPVLIRGAEHWCQGFHNWVCAGIAVRDAVTEEPTAVLNISRWQTSLPAAATSWLSEAVTTAKGALRKSAWRAGTELVAAFGQAQARSRAGLAVPTTRPGCTSMFLAAVPLSTREQGGTQVWRTWHVWRRTTRRPTRPGSATLRSPRP